MLRSCGEVTMRLFVMKFFRSGARWRRVLAAALTLTALPLAGLAGASGASAAVPRCTPLVRYSPGPHAWFDKGDVKSQLVVGIDRLVCSAADGATIDLKSWFINVDGPAVRHLVADLALMHRYHRVRVNVLVGRSGYGGVYGPARWRTFLRAFSFAHVGSCYYSCRSTTRGSVEHGKWVAVSKLRQGVPAVLSTSANISTQQYSTVETGILVVGNRPLYSAFRARFASLQACAVSLSSSACGRRDTAHQPAARWYGERGTYVYFAPASTDPVTNALRNVTCRRTDTHRLVVLASLFLTRSGVVAQVARLRREGCIVRVVLEHVPSALAETLDPRCLYNHDKTLLVHTAKSHWVISGSENFAPGSLHSSGQQMVLSTLTYVVAGYERFYATLWPHAKTC
jgi:hypothetical protein